MDFKKFYFSPLPENIACMKNLTYPISCFSPGNAKNWRMHCILKIRKKILKFLSNFFLAILSYQSNLVFKNKFHQIFYKSANWALHCENQTWSKFLTTSTKAILLYRYILKKILQNRRFLKLRNGVKALVRDLTPY